LTVSVADVRAGWRGDGPLTRAADLLRRRPEVLTAILCAVVVAVGQRGPDLPAQAYRVALFRSHGLVVFDTHWYAGHPLPGYSLLFPPLAGLFGSRLIGALACIASTAALVRLLRGTRRTGHDVALLWFSAVTVVDLVVGRLPFALGLALGIGALAAQREGRRWWALGLSVACGCASPLAGAFLLLAALAWLSTTSWRRVWPLSGPVVGLAAAAAFGEGGRFPFPFGTLLAVLLFVGIGLTLAPRESTLIRRGLVLYGGTALVLFFVPNPIGGNIVRLGAVLAGPVAAYELARLGRRTALALVAVPLVAWQFAPVPTAIATGHENPSAHAAYYAGLVTYLAGQGAAAGRLEVPLTQGRWETDYLAAKVALARGWERQVDLAHNSVLYDPHLTPAAYRAWLMDNGVRWVALPDVPLDSSEKGEHALLTGPPLPFLQPVWHDAHWRVWAVVGAHPLVTGAARLVSVGVSQIRLEALRPGGATVLVRWTRFWRVTRGPACVGPGPDGWTSVSLVGRGPVTLTADVGFGAITGSGSGGSCSARAAR
jgi:hypothetical protein